MAENLWHAEFLDALGITSSDTVLDVGCNEGQVCALAGRTGAELVGIDIVPLFIARAVERLQAVARSFRGLVSNCDPIPLPDGAVSVVICTEVLEHVDEPVRLLAELARVGRPGARYLFSVPDVVSEEVMRVVAPAWYFEKNHQRVFGRQEFHDLVCSAGLEVKEHRFCGFTAAMSWFLRMVMGMEHAGTPPPPAPSLLSDWEKVSSSLAATPRGLEVLHALSQFIPKSHVVIAQKPISPPPPAPQKPSPRWKNAVKRLLGHGRIQLGNFEICVRRRVA
jgi:SAM-dependent methyltransferase